MNPHGGAPSTTGTALAAPAKPEGGGDEEACRVGGDDNAYLAR
jgi:hypothetical protein